MSMLLSIVFLLVANSYRHIRSILSLVIVGAMVCFNISTQPCFVEQINYWRTYGLCCILWVALIVTMLTNETSTLSNTGIGGVASALAVGAAILLVLFVVIRCIYRASRKKEAGEERDALVNDDSTDIQLTQTGGLSMAQSSAQGMHNIVPASSNTIAASK
ncbi:hypothetical protein IWW55_005358 [Coemansia sp. RSA 2706]|nr:hypothetical protein IWW55_005358 [Coemansia sp. RSA 2706]